MEPADFAYELPEALIAQYPPAERAGARLLCLDRADGALADRRFIDLPDLLHPGDLLIFNDTRVIAARLYGRKASGGKVEVMVERLLSPNRALAQVRSSHAPVAGSGLVLDGGFEVTVAGREGEFFVLECAAGESLSHVIDSVGHIPLPPYIRRADAPQDRERYQTVFARRDGAVAAPTAGLHFDESLLSRFAERGVHTGFVTLHVGAGTFQPLRTERIEEHVMHKEWFEVGEELCARVEETRAHGGRVIAVGTTTVRSLETAAAGGTLSPAQGETDLFIVPGFQFKVVDAMVTNFHLPESTLLMLVCAFAGRERVLDAYAHAVQRRYRFYSYGDAMLIA